MSMLNDESPQELDRFLDQAVPLLVELERSTGVQRSPYYIQSFVVAAYGEPSVRMRWSAEIGSYEREPTTEADGR